MSFRRFTTGLLLGAALALVAACDSSEERAEKYYQSGLQYLQKGEVERALVEFRNVFKLNGRHKEARRTFAEVERGRGNFRETYSQYLRLVEQYPDDLPALKALAELASLSNDWALMMRFSMQALAIAPDDASLLAAKTVAEYGLSLDKNDSAATVAAVAKARKMREEQPDNLLLRRVIVDDLIRSHRNEEALTEIESALLVAPEDQALYGQRLSIYAAMGDEAAVEAGLLDMAERFPKSQEIKSGLMRWYISRKEFDKAESYLRGQMDASGGDVTLVLDLIRFLAQYRGAETAVSELDRHITPGDSNPVFRAARANFLYDLGRRQESIAEMQEILTTAPPTEDLRRIKIGLARMLNVDGNIVAAQQLVEEVLAEDSGDVEALKLKAGWLILGDEVGEAISILRSALDYKPRDPSIMTLMAQAYERDGNRDLMREMLSLAVEASQRAPEESLRYAQFLASEGKFIPAEGTLIDALRVSPGTVSLLVPLGQIYVQLKDWPRAKSVVEALETIGEADVQPDIVQLRTAILAGQQQLDEAVGYLEGLAAEDSNDLKTRIAIVRAHLANGEDAKALAYSTKLLAENPDNAAVRFADASVRALTGDPAAAEATYRALLAEDPTRLPAWMSLFRLVAADPARQSEVADLVEEALAHAPDSEDLQWAKAGILERGGDFDGAIAIYEALYQKNSANAIVANNLASLLSNHRSDPESLARAEVVARRLRDSGQPAFQDTYGWIAHLLGRHQDALGELEAAVAGLPKDPAVQYHLAMTYAALGRKGDALGRLQKARALLPADGSGTLADAIGDEIGRLESEGVVPAN
ncbi:MAG: tetratricopeptide repeat protein [Rhodobacteraceae bacterium]|nr:tetratricopeptide repeat protein [Paracoccaceae bacterium]